MSVYTPETLAACEKALRTLLAGIGPWGPSVVLVGGLVPQYLIPEPPADVDDHVGTTDLDMVIGVSIASEDQTPYRTLAHNLRDAGFSRGGASHQWTREVDGIPVTLEFFCPADDTPPGKLLRNPAEGIGSAISAIALRGAELAARDVHRVALRGETLDGGGIREVEVSVANLLPFLVLKAFALDERVKDKDAYDIVWVLTAFPGGPQGACATAIASPIRDDAVALDGIARLREHFAGIDNAGPAQYSRFLRLQGDDAVRARRFARGSVDAFLSAWDEARHDPS